MNCKAILFDLDGTTLDTLDDLADSVNFALNALGFPRRTTEEIRMIVGNGVHNLITRALPENAGANAFEKCLALYKAHYEKNKENKTAPYEGIADMLKLLSARGYKMAIVSNKHEDAVLSLSRKFFSDCIDVIIGNSDTLPRKPAPDMVFAALERLGEAVSDAVYVGDSEVDAQTAANAGCMFIGVSWGFRDESLLRSCGASYIAKSPKQLYDIILNL